MLSDDDKARIIATLTAAVTAKAAEFAADPAKGYAQGYAPAVRYVPSNTIGVSTNKLESDAAWLRGVATVDLKDWYWDVVVGPDSRPALKITGPR